MKPKYLERIKAITSSGLFALNGNRLLIELLSEGEKKTASGLVVSLDKGKPHMSAPDAARVAVVLATGPGYTVEKERGTFNDKTGEEGISTYEEHVDMPYKAGEYVLVNQFAVKTFSEFFGLPEYKDGDVGLITDDLVQGRIVDLAAFITAIKTSTTT